MNKLCVAIRSLNRVDYLKKCLQSLEKQVDLNADFWFFQDGAVNPYSGKRYATDEEIEASLQAFKDCKLPNKYIFQHKQNEGCLPQYFFQIDMLSHAYDYIASVPNDLEFNKYYIKTLNTLFRQFEDDPKVGILSSSFWCFNKNVQTLEEAKQMEDKVSYGYGYQTEQCFWAKKWPQIRPHMKKYIDLMMGHDYYLMLHNQSPSQEVRKQLKALYGNHPADYCLEQSVKLAGFTGLQVRALRYRIIGAKGLYSFHSSLWEQQFKDVKMYDVGDVDKYIMIESIREDMK